MAQSSGFDLGDNAWLGVLGVTRPGDQAGSAAAEGAREATVDVVIRAINEHENIIRCLASVMRQTLRPRYIVLVDDGSEDDTSERAHAFCEFHGVTLFLIRRFRALGKTPTLREQVRELDSDVLFVLDADTVLESTNYIERTVHHLYQDVRIASASGRVLPLREQDRRAADESRTIHSFMNAWPSFRSTRKQSRFRRFVTRIAGLHRDVFYRFFHRLVDRGQMVLFGTVVNPTGSAVAYRRKYLEALFDNVKSRRGDEVRSSGDIVIGRAMLDEGYRSIQLADVLARTIEPDMQRLPKQAYVWTSALLHSALVRCPKAR